MSQTAAEKAKAISKLNTANKNEAMSTPINSIFIDSPVYIFLNSGEVSILGYLKQNTAKNERLAKKMEMNPLIFPSPMIKRLVIESKYNKINLKSETIQKHEYFKGPGLFPLIWWLIS